MQAGFILPQRTTVTCVQCRCFVIVYLYKTGVKVKSGYNVIYRDERENRGVFFLIAYDLTCRSVSETALSQSSYTLQHRVVQSNTGVR